MTYIALYISISYRLGVYDFKHFRDSPQALTLTKGNKIYHTIRKPLYDFLFNQIKPLSMRDRTLDKSWR